MQRSEPKSSPLDRVGENLDDGTTEALKILGNEIRMAILLALWEEADNDQPPLEKPTLSFSQLRDRVGVVDSGQFNYHLDKLTGVYLERVGGEYRPLPACGVLLPLMTNKFAENESFENVPIDGECHHCGSSTVIDYSEQQLNERCPNCAGCLECDSAPAGTIASRHIPPGALENRTLEEFNRDASARFRLKLESLIEGFCPICAGTVTPNLHVCEDHRASDASVCEGCGFQRELSWLFVCDVCKYAMWTSGRKPIFVDDVVERFFAEHGLDLPSLYDTGKRTQIYDAVESVDLLSSDPPEVKVALELEGDRLEITLDENARRAAVTEETS